MSTPSSAITCTGAPLSALEADLLIVPWLEDDRRDLVVELDRATHGEVTQALSSSEFRGRPFEIFLTPVAPGEWRAKRLMLVGAGRSDSFGSGQLRRVAAAAALQARQRRFARAAVVLHGLDSESHRVVLARAVAEGLTLGEYHTGTYKTSDPPAPVPHWTIAVSHDDPALEGQVARSRVLGECSNLAREMANEPGNFLTPQEFANRAAAVAYGGGVSVEILDEQRIAKLGMGLLLGVARGSAEPPRLTVFRHDPAGAPPGPVLGLVGKGVTFDTGGISIKPAEGMDRMKDDMAGGAAVACAMRAVALLGAPIRVVGVVPMAENMPGGRAVKPGDVLRSAEGKTVEVLNTDAEGRLLLGDALWYARSLGATHLVDVATLTGAIVVALGKGVSGVFGTPERWVQHIRTVGESCGDSMWALPLVDEYRDQLKSEIADFSNTGGRPAGSITAALFLREFTGGLPWAHLDVAGTAWAEDAKPFLPKGPSGVAVRTLAELACSAAAWPAL